MLTAALTSPATPSRSIPESSETRNLNDNNNNNTNDGISTTSHLRIVPHLDSTRSMVFGVIEKDVTDGVLLKIGRFTEKYPSPTRITFKSKVVSRGHAEIWMDNGKFYIRDTKSSSGTFLNHTRLSAPNQESRPYALTDGDIVQLGVDYKGGTEEIYRCVKMRFEINRPTQKPTAFSLNTFQSLRNMTTPPNNVSILDSAMTRQDNNRNKDNDDHDIHIEECCICLYALAPFQCLFVAPCSHTFHYKCATPLLVNHPGFNCPLCRSYADLDASVAVEASEVMEMYKRGKQETAAMDGSGSIAMAAATLVDTKTDDSVIQDPRSTDPTCIPPSSS